MALVSMKLTKKEAASLIGQPSIADAPEYPYGLSINICDDQLDALGLGDMPAVGTVVEIRALAVVQSVSASDRQDGKAHRDMSLQITDLDVQPQGQSPANKLYNKTNMTT